MLWISHWAKLSAVKEHIHPGLQPPYIPNKIVKGVLAPQWDNGINEGRKMTAFVQKPWEHLEALMKTAAPASDQDIKFYFDPKAPLQYNCCVLKEENADGQLTYLVLLVCLFVFFLT